MSNTLLVLNLCLRNCVLTLFYFSLLWCILYSSLTSEELLVNFKLKASVLVTLRLNLLLQAKLLYNVPLSENERQNIKLVIQSNLYRYLGLILEAREIFEESLCEKTNGQHFDESTSSGNLFCLNKNLTKRSDLFEWSICVHHFSP